MEPAYIVPLEMKRQSGLIKVWEIACGARVGCKNVVSGGGTCVLGAFGGSVTRKRGIIDGDALALDGHYVGIG